MRRPGTVEDLVEELNDEYACRQPWLWCDRIQLETGSSIERELMIQREDFVGDLTRMVDDLASSPVALRELRQSLQQLYDSPRARRYLRELLPDDDELTEILRAAEAECLAELGESGDGA